MWKPPDQFFEVQSVKNDWGTSFDDVVAYRKPDVSAVISSPKEPANSADCLLDKDAYAASLLALANEHIERNGQRHFVHEAKDRIAALKLYGETMGFVGQKALIDASTNFTNNEMRVILVEPDAKTEIEVEKPILELDEKPTNITPLRIKAV